MLNGRLTAERVGATPVAVEILHRSHPVCDSKEKVLTGRGRGVSLTTE